jgi:hypothetical protein
MPANKIVAKKNVLKNDELPRIEVQNKAILANRPATFSCANGLAKNQSWAGFGNSPKNRKPFIPQMML